MAAFGQKRPFIFQFMFLKFDLFNISDNFDGCNIFTNI